MRLARATIFSLVSIATLAGTLSAQTIPRVRPVISAVWTSPNVQLTPRCETINFFNNIKKIWEIKQTGNVVFKMNVTGSPAGLFVSNASGSADVAVANGQDTPSILPGSDVLDFHAAGGGSVPFATVVGNQFANLGWSGSIYHVWNWPTGMGLWGANRWAANKCNNVPVKPITIQEVSPWIKEINKGLIVANPVGPGGLGTGTLGTGSASQNEQIKNRF